MFTSEFGVVTLNPYKNVIYCYNLCLINFIHTQSDIYYANHNNFSLDVFFSQETLLSGFLTTLKIRSYQEAI